MVSGWFRYYSANPFTMVRDCLDLKAAGVIDLYDKIMTAATPEEQKKLMKAKTESLQSAKRIEELYADAMKAFQSYKSSADDHV